eukprot:5408003-Pleurochrysis_carterae.AAC.3
MFVKRCGRGRGIKGGDRADESVRDGTMAKWPSRKAALGLADEGDGRARTRVTGHSCQNSRYVMRECMHDSSWVLFARVGAANATRVDVSRVARGRTEGTMSSIRLSAISLSKIFTANVSYEAIGKWDAKAGAVKR